MEYILHPKQWLALCRAAVLSITIYLGGIRSGKTITGAHFALRMILERPDEVGAIFSNTNKQLTKATLKEFKKVLASYGLFENTHYFVNKNPEKRFGYRSMFAHHEGVWSFWNGAQLYCFSLETAIRGVEFGWAWGDETQNADKADLDVVMGRMSGSKRGARTFYTLTPPYFNPDIDAMIYNEQGGPKDNVIVGTTYDNAKNLPEGYIELLLSTYDDVTFSREVKCERTGMGAKAWLYAFNRDKHVNEAAVYNPESLVYISLDFNNNPFVGVLSHRGVKDGKRFIHYFDTVEITPDKIKGTDLTFIDAIIDEIQRKTPSQAAKNAYMITGDASGRQQSVLMRVGQNIWTEIMQKLRIPDSQKQVKNSNPTHQDSRVLCNSILAKYDQVYIHPKCTALIRDCEFVQAKDDGSIKKDSRSKVDERSDFLDALRYCLYAFNGDWLPK